MRRCFWDVDFLRFEEDGPIAGVNLGYGRCGEHEDGIRILEESFGLKKEKIGLEGRMNTIFPTNLALSVGKKTTALIFYDLWLPNIAPLLLNIPDEYFDKAAMKISDILSGELALHRRSENLATAWSKYDFGIHVTNEYNPVLRNLFEAFADNRAVISLSALPINPFGKSGLIIADYNLIPEEIKEDTRENDPRTKEQKELLKLGAGYILGH